MPDQATLPLALAQLCSAHTHETNIATVTAIAQAAASAGCKMLALPEVAGLMNRRARPEDLFAADQDPFIAAMRALAADTGLWIHIGSTPLTGGADGRLRNHSALIDAKGRIVASYDKIHLFDIQLDGRKPILESSRFAPGETISVAETPWGLAAMTVCYDLRFPQIYRDYAQLGTMLVFIPSAFTVPTGEAHWEVLIRARAIETGSFVIASAQVGHHADGRTTYGHAMVVDPWGTVLVDLKDRVGWTRVDLDMTAVQARRSQIPSLRHDRKYARP